MKASVYLLAEFTEWACRTYRGSVTSWWRSPKRNAAKGGLPTSFHLTGEAVDVVWDTDSVGPHDKRPPPLEELSAVAGAYFVRIVRESDHDHFQSGLPHLQAAETYPGPRS